MHSHCFGAECVLTHLMFLLLLLCVMMFCVLQQKKSPTASPSPPAYSPTSIPRAPPPALQLPLPIPTPPSTSHSAASASSASSATPTLTAAASHPSMRLPPLSATAPTTTSALSGLPQLPALPFSPALTRQHHIKQEPNGSVCCDLHLLLLYICFDGDWC